MYLLRALLFFSFSLILTHSETELQQEEGVALANKIGAVKYLESSSTSVDDLRNAAKEMMLMLVQNEEKSHKEHRCVVS